jgi:GT2 family glycosyltransferase/Tfp pilus assembly protein PilF
VGFLSFEAHGYACPTLRLKSVLEHLNAAGALELVPLGAVREGQFQIQETNFKRAEIIVVQRQMAARLPYAELRKRLNGRPAKIVFEIDDALTLLPEWHRASAAFRQIQPQIEEYLQRADLVTVSTPQLQAIYAPLNRNIVVLPNSVDTRLWSSPTASLETSDKVTILFSGTLDHQRDLQVIEPALLDLIAAFPDQVEFLYWGNITERLLDLRQVKAVGAFLPNYREYAARLQKLPVSFAIVPLEDNDFNRAKSAIKWLEYSVCRIPGIYSDLPAYNATVMQGETGLLVPNTRDGWFNAMKTLVEDQALRHDLAARAQAAVLARHTVEHNAKLWLQAYNSLFTSSVPQRTAEAVPEVSIVIPTFNKVELTRHCLAAIQQHTPAGRYEVIVVDNGSTDGTGDFLKVEEAEDRLRTVVNAENLGFAQACNQGVQAARGEYVLFLNNDTEVQAGWLDPLISLADEDANIAAVGSKLVFPDGTLQHAGVAIGEVIGRDPLLAVHTFYKASADLPEANQRRVYQALTAACLLVRKSAFEAVGGFDEGFWNGYEDVDLCLRFQERGWLMVYEPASVVIHHESQSGPARFQKVQENIRRLHEKWLGKAKLDVSVAADGAVSPAGTTRIRPYVPGAVGAADTSIVILTHNQLAHTKACLESIAQHTPEPHELILVDNGSTDGTQDYLLEYAAQRERVFVVANRTNRGFAAGNNQGLALATGRQVLFLNNDTVVTPGWLGNMLRVLQEHPQTGVVGPRSNRVLGKQQVDDVGYKSLDELPAFAVAWAEKQAGQSRVANRVVGFCLLARRELIEAVGGLDEQFGSGNFEDDDFCIRAHLAGFETRIADDAFVHHVGNATFTGAGIDYAKAMQTNWGLFKSKWAIPPETPPFPGYLTPDVAPPGVALKVPLPELKLTHQPSADGRCWMDMVMAAAKAKPIILPPCALVGNLREARQFFEQKKLPAAWGATRAALKHRPFHPEAYLLLAEIALAAQASVAARDCAQFARQLAPEFRPAKKFLKGKIYGNAKPDWLVLPEEIGKHKAEGRHHLSVCLIVKNEERFLGRCLASVKGLAHQIVVVDTGSTDRTVEIAREHGAQVHAFAWCDDFSAARNAALEHATGDWVLMVDADEELPAEQQAALRKLLRAPEVIAWRLPLQDVGSEAEGCNYVPRLFRNAPGFFYAGRVHEQVFASIEVRRQEWGLDTRLGDATLRHYGYTKELTLERDKVGRNLRLLEQAILEMPGETNLLMNYGLELTRSGRPAEGLAQYRAAFTAMAALPPAVVVPETREMLLSQFCTQLMAAKRYAEIVQGLTSPLAKLGGGLTASLYFTLGLAQMELKEFAAAAEQFRQCLAKRDRPALTPVNLEIRKAGPRHCLALCLEQMGETDAAAEEFRLALETEPLAWPVRHDYARFLAAHDRQIEALNLFFALAGEKPGEAQVWLQGGQLALTRPEFLEVALDWTAEAERHLPDDPAVVQQRAEALMLAGQCSMALPLWRRWPSGSNPALAAALVLCETVVGENQFSPAAAAEVAVSREFVSWYQRLLRFNAQPTVEALNARVEELQRVLPSAAGILTSALAEVSAEISA